MYCVIRDSGQPSFDVYLESDNFEEARQFYIESVEQCASPEQLYLMKRESGRLVRVQGY